ncbi:MAG: LysR family transcriptional regulator [Pseudomonadota bacterium]
MSKTPTSTPRISLEQWRTLLAVVDAGGYAQAAEQLNKSQSTVTYAIKKLESVLDVAVFKLEGRRAVLTPTGELLYERAETLVKSAARLEQTARQVSAGWEAEIRVSADVIFPVWLLLDCFAEFGRHSPHTHIECVESVMGGTLEELHSGRADMVISNHIPQGFYGTALMTLRFLPVASPNHALHQKTTAISPDELLRHRHLFVRETDGARKSKTTSTGAQRWTVSNMSTSIGAVCRGYGYAWFPEHKIQGELARGELKPIALSEPNDRLVTVYLILAQPQSAGPGVQRLRDIIVEQSQTLGADAITV